MIRKLKKQNAETLIEALVSLLIVLLSMGLLSSSVMAAANINKANRELDEEYSQELQMAEGLIEDGYTAKEVDVKVEFEKGIGAGRSKTVKVKLYGADDSDFISYQYE